MYVKLLFIECANILLLLEIDLRPYPPKWNHSIDHKRSLKFKMPPETYNSHGKSDTHMCLAHWGLILKNLTIFPYFWKSVRRVLQEFVHNARKRKL